MNNPQRAIISWISAKDGGRKTPPPGPQYSTLVHFEEDPGWEKGAWSLMVDYDKDFQNPRVVLARVRFLSEDGPRDLLHAGSRFELFEGKKRVAKGIVLPAVVSVPDQISEFEAALIG
jgi:hypothetical protein